MFKSIFFDLDATLLDEKKARDLAIEDFYQQFSHEIHQTLQESINCWRDGVDKFFPLFTQGKISFLEQRRERVRLLFSDSSMSDQRADEYFKFYLSCYEANWDLFPEVLPVLDSLSSYKLGIITNGDSFQQRKKIEVLGLSNKFEVIVISGEFGIAKPRAEIFEYACKSIDSVSKKCVYVGDQLEDDAVASQRTGMKGVWINRNEKVAPSQEVATFKNLNEFRSALYSLSL